MDKNLSFEKNKLKLRNIFVVIIIVIVSIAFIQFFSLFVNEITTIFMYLSIICVYLGVFFVIRLEKSFVKINEKIKKFSEVDSIYNSLSHLLENEEEWIEFYENETHLYISRKSTFFYQIINVLFFIVVSIIVILQTIAIFSVFEGKMDLILLNTIQLLLYVFFFPLFIIKMLLHKEKYLYQNAKKVLNYIKKRNMLIFYNKNIQNEKYKELKERIGIINLRIENFNRIFNPISYYIKDLIAIISLIISVLFNIQGFEYFIIMIFYIIIFYLPYIIFFIKSWFDMKKSIFFKQIGSDLDIIAFADSNCSPKEN